MARRPRGESGTARQGVREQGFALVAVVMSIAVLTLFLLGALAYAMNGMAPARRDQDAKTAEQAALAGVEEYIARLNANDNYWKVGNTDATNAAFSATGQVIQGTGGSTSTAARYTYSLLSDADTITSSGIIRVRVTGMSGPPGGTSTVKRTLLAELNRAGLLNYVYLSDVEVIDPAIISQSSGCSNYYYAYGGNPARPASGCQNIQWGSGDVVQGPLHSNDALQVAGTTKFTDPGTESSWPAIKNAASGAKTWWGAQSGSLPGYSPKYADPISLPLSNNELLKNVAPDIDGDGDVGPGCYYTGATRIVLNGTTMKVLSPSTTRSGIPSRCYNTSTPGTEQTVAIPPVIYIDPTSATCVQGAVGYPATNEFVDSSNGASATAWEGPNADASTNYSCRRGTAYVSGTAKSPVTIAGADDVVIVGNLQPDATTGTNVIGLIAGNCVWVYHPIKSNSTNANLLGAPVSTVRAAILALRHSFIVQNWWSGAATGNLTVYGAIAQKYRGTVGGTYNGATRGYTKAYAYDGRLTYTQPPFFLKASNSPFKIQSLTDG